MIEFLNKLAELANVGLLALALFAASWAIVFALVLTTRGIAQAVRERHQSPANKRREIERGSLADIAKEAHA